MAGDGNIDSCDVEMNSLTGDDEVTNKSDHCNDGNTTGCWFEHPKYNRYWTHHRKVCDWFKQHREVKRELEKKQYMQRYQQWYQQQFSSANSYTQYMNWCYQMYAWYMQNAGGYGHSYTHSMDNSHAFKVPSSPVPKSRTTPTAENDRRRKRTESQSSRTSDSRPSSRGSNSQSMRRKRKKRREKKRRKEQIVVQMDDGEYILESGSDDGTEEFEMEITEDMLQFFAASAKHRHLRDTMKEKDEKTGEERRVPKEETYVELGEVGAGKNKATVLPPSERPGVKRTSEMKLLYGQGAAMIHGMETAMQLTFDRNCDIKQPKLWPQLPLNIKFD